MIKLKNALFLPAGFMIATVQKTSAALFGLVMKYLWGGYTATIHLPKLSHTKRYIIAANHQSHEDAFAIYAPLSFRQRSRIAPVKFMMIPKLYHRWWLKPFVYILGAFPAHIKERHHHTYGVEGSIKLLDYGYNICIFPEGGLTTQAESVARPGIVRIIEARPNITLLLAHIEWTKTAKNKRHLRLVVAPAPPNLDKSDPQAIMNAIYAL